MRRIITGIAFLSTLSMADVIGGELNLGFYNHSPSGYAQYQGDKVDVEKDLKWNSEGDYVSYDGNTLYDAEVGLRYTFLLGLGLEAGYKTMKLKLNDVDDLTMKSDL